MSESMPGYDAWKLASPPEYEEEEFECSVCGDTYPDEDDAEECCAGEERGARGAGREDEGPDPDDAYEEQREREYERSER